MRSGKNTVFNGSPDCLEAQQKIYPETCIEEVGPAWSG